MSLSLAVGLAATSTWGDTSTTSRKIGTSQQGRDLIVRVIADPAPDELGRGPDERPALAIIAGLDASHRVGRDVALGLLQIAEEQLGESLRGRTLYILPIANPDGFAQASQEGAPSLDSGRAPRSVDADRDGRRDEDPANDLNGDGLITMMRVAHPSPSSGLKAEWVVDEHDPRVLRKPDSSKGEVATHALLIEGTDDDGDGAFNEDGPGGSGGGGVDLDRNYPSLWEDLAEGAGLYPTSEPETRALIAWLQSRPNIASVLVYGKGDNLLNIPSTKAKDDSGRMPGGLDEADQATFKRVAEWYKDAVPYKSAPAPHSEGSLATWAYSDLGVWAFHSAVWARPEPAKDKDQAKGVDKPGSAEQAAPEPDQTDATERVDPTAAQRTSLTQQGVSPVIIEFLLANETDRAAMIESFEAASPEEQAEIQSAIATAPPEIRARVNAIVSTGIDPQAPTEPDEPESSDPNEASSENAGKHEKKADKPVENEDTRWLKYFDGLAEEAAPNPGFSDWQPFQHPQLGTVEIGGFVPGARTNPPAGEIPELIEDQALFVGKLLDALPDLTVGTPTVERLGSKFWRISLRFENRGVLPTLNELGQTTRRVPRAVAVISVPDEAVIAGSRLQTLPPIEGGGSTYLEWTVMAEPDTELAIEIRSARFGNRQIPVSATVSSKEAN